MKFRITDLFCLLLFFSFICFNLYLTYFSITKGNPKSLLQFYDRNKNQCGSKNLKDYKYIYSNSWNLERKHSYCIKECPKTKDTVLDFHKEENENINIKWVNSKPTKNFYGICLPNFELDKIIWLKNSSISLEVQVILEEIKNNFCTIVVSGCISWLLVLVMVLLIKLFPKTIVLIIYIISLVFLSASSFYLYKISQYYKNINIKNENIDKNNPETNESLIDINKNYSRYAGIISLILLVVNLILLIILIFCIKKMFLCSRIFKLVSDFIFDVNRILLVPFIAYSFMFMFIFVNILVLINLLTIGEAEPYEDYIFNKIKRTRQVKIFILLFVLYIIWICFYIKEMINYIGIYSVINWFVYNEDHKDRKPLRNSLKGSLFFNAGSLAFSSLILLIVFVLSVILQTFIFIFKKSNPSSNIIFQYMDKIGTFYLNILNRFIEFINRICYSEIIINQKSFCISALESSKTIIANSVSFGVLGFFSFVFKLIFFIFIIGITLLCNYMYYGWEFFKEKYIVVIIISLFSIVISLMFIEIYIIGSESLMYVYLKFEEMIENKNVNTIKKIKKLVYLHDKKIDDKKENL